MYFLGGKRELREGTGIKIENGFLNLILVRGFHKRSNGGLIPHFLFIFSLQENLLSIENELWRSRHQLEAKNG
jgi:ADP-ribose pyrophosphatase YjhB (NUDIX family)